MNIESEYSNEVLDTMIDFINYLAPELQSKVKMKNAPSIHINFFSIHQN